MASRYPCVLTIAGSDSGGGAGIQADIKTFAALGVYGATVITAVTAQNTVGVHAIYELPQGIVAAQLDAVLEDLPITAVKIGMLSSTETIRTVANRLHAHQMRNIVLDTVMCATSGDPLLRDEAVLALIKTLLPMATLITPNLPEATRLLQLAEISDTETAARALLAIGAQAVLLKGGHGDGDQLEDLLLTPESAAVRFQHDRVPTAHTHGTGCSLSSAIAAELAHGVPLPVAVQKAIDWLHGAIIHSWPLGEGRGPVHHFWRIWPPADDQSQEKS